MVPLKTAFESVTPVAAKVTTVGVWATALIAVSMSIPMAKETRRLCINGKVIAGCYPKRLWRTRINLSGWSHLCSDIEACECLFRHIETLQQMAILLSGAIGVTSPPLPSLASPLLHR